MDPVVAVAVGLLWLLFNLFGKKKPSGQVRQKQPVVPPQPASKTPRLKDVTPERMPRAVVDFDDEAEQIAARRIASIQENSRELGVSDHVKFDERIRREATDATTTPAVSIALLRNAIVWREILGPPVSLRDPADL